MTSTIVGWFLLGAMIYPLWRPHPATHQDIVVAIFIIISLMPSSKCGGGCHQGPKGPGEAPPR